MRIVVAEGAEEGGHRTRKTEEPGSYSWVPTEAGVEEPRWMSRRQFGKEGEEVLKASPKTW